MGSCIDIFIPWESGWNNFDEGCYVFKHTLLIIPESSHGKTTREARGKICLF